MTIQEPPPHSHQAFRRVYETEEGATNGPPADTALSDIIQIPCLSDVTSGQDIILWDDILTAFTDVVHVCSGTAILPFLQGPDVQKYVSAGVRIFLIT
jgi:hypothetical protein